MDYSQLYYKCFRQELIRHVHAGPNKVLDVGCAEGVLGEALKQRGLASEVIGIELFPDAANVAKSRLDRVICGDIESIVSSAHGLEPGYFDYIICGDVLEHLRDPARVMNWLVSQLKEDGRLVASIPNVRHWSVIVPLLFQGKWEYRAHGIMDQTHLRFFTRKTAIRLFEEAGLHVELCEGTKLRGRKDKLLNFLMLGMGKELVTIQWTLVGYSCKKFT